VKISLLRRFVALADHLHFPRAAEALGIPLASLYTSIDKLEAEVGHPLVTRDNGPTRLTPAGRALLVEAREQIANAPEPVKSAPAPAGGKAKASKGKGRAPAVKGSRSRTRSGRGADAQSQAR
jgi:hypothetical protein